jgi:hypothetical protein
MSKLEHGLKKSKYWTIEGCEAEGTITIPKTFFNFMQNISGYCTDKTEFYFNNPEAMFEALNLIWKGLNDIALNANPETKVTK